MRATVIVPFHRNLSQLAASLAAIRLSVPDVEIIVAADGALDDCRPLAAEQRATVVTVPGPSGPAVARNRAAARATGDVLVFVDADVVPAPDAIPGMLALLAREQSLAGVFGAYDRTPAAQNFMSQFKNLAHCYVHETGHPEAKTFWAGLGAVRAEAFRAVGGFDERFARPSVEDIELGYRITQTGRRLRLDPTFRGTHLKRWTLRNCIVTDIAARGVPWTQLIHRYGALTNDLNTSHALRLSVVAAYGVVVAAALAFLSPWWLAVSATLIASLVGLNRSYYRWCANRRGLIFAARVVPVHLVHHLCNGISFVVGSALHVAGRLNLPIPGALPRDPWVAGSLSPQVPPLSPR